MVSRHHSLDLSEIADITDMLCGFEEHNKCCVVMTVKAVTKGSKRGLVIEASAYPNVDDFMDQPPWGSVSVECSTMNLKTWNSALIHVMYGLDFQLALHELGHAAPQKA